MFDGKFKVYCFRIHIVFIVFLHAARNHNSSKKAEIVEIHHGILSERNKIVHYSFIFGQVESGISAPSSYIGSSSHINDATPSALIKTPSVIQAPQHDPGALSIDPGALSIDPGALSSYQDALSSYQDALSIDPGALSSYQDALSITIDRVKEINNAKIHSKADISPRVYYNNGQCAERLKHEIAHKITPNVACKTMRQLRLNILTRENI